MAYEPQLPAYGGNASGFSTEESMRLVLMELRAIRQALVFLATSDGKALVSDFDPQNVDADITVTNQSN
jgi:hypothetical protein